MTEYALRRMLKTEPYDLNIMTTLGSAGIAGFRDQRGGGAVGIVGAFQSAGPSVP